MGGIFCLELLAGSPNSLVHTITTVNGVWVEGQVRSYGSAAVLPQRAYHQQTGPIYLISDSSISPLLFSSCAFALVHLQQ